MESVATTRMSSKGQVVIPESLRQQLGLESGARFIVMGEDDVIILKTIQTPSMRDFDRMIAKARRQAKQAGMKRSDIAAAISRVRAAK
jgi:AbrB family looped-hinge helix DNA binding protein